jgi:hypothetical protein
MAAILSFAQGRVLSTLDDGLVRAKISSGKLLLPLLPAAVLVTKELIIDGFPAD